MAEEQAADPAAAPKKRSKLPLLIGLVLMLVLGGGGFYATYSGLLFGAKGEAAAAEGGGHGAAAKGASGHGSSGGGSGHGEAAGGALGDVEFVTIPPLIITLDPSARSSHLRFAADLEVDRSKAALVTKLMPRVLDVLNGYLRAVQVSDLEDPAALMRLRAQMLRRVQTVLGEGMAKDLLITEFVLN